MLMGLSTILPPSAIFNGTYDSSRQPALVEGPKRISSNLGEVYFHI